MVNKDVYIIRDSGFNVGPSHTLRHWVRFIWRLFNSNNFAGSAALLRSTECHSSFVSVFSYKTLTIISLYKFVYFILACGLKFFFH